MLEQQWWVLLQRIYGERHILSPFFLHNIMPFPLESFLPLYTDQTLLYFFLAHGRGHLFFEDFFESTEQSSELFLVLLPVSFACVYTGELKPSMQFTSTLTWLYYPNRLFDLTLVCHEALSWMIWAVNNFTFHPRTSKEFHQLTIVGSICGQLTPDSLNLHPQKSCIAMSSTITSLKVLHHDSCPIVIKLPHCKTCFKTRLQNFSKYPDFVLP